MKTPVCRKRLVPFACALLLTLYRPGAVSGQTVEPIHSFSGCVATGCADGDYGAHPRTTLAVAPDGTLFGNASGGGSSYGFGTLFKVLPDGSFTRLFTFGDESV